MYNIDGKSVQSVYEMRDLGVIIDSELSKCFLSRDRNTLVRAFLTYVRPIPELVTGRVHPRVGSGRVGSGRVGSGRVGSGRVGSGRENLEMVRVGSGRVSQLSSGFFSQINIINCKCILHFSMSV
jgi:hypothetical protein